MVLEQVAYKLHSAPVLRTEEEHCRALVVAVLTWLS